jgi:glycosyltransferase involved in cell wall biosynthesis
MRILYLIHQFLPEFATGTERVTMNIARTQQRNGHGVDVLTCSVRGASYWSHEQDGLRYAVVEGMRVFGLPRELLGRSAEFGADTNQQAVSIISRFLDRSVYDVVHVMHSMRMLEAVEMIRHRAIPYILTLTDFFAVCHRINLKRLDGSYCGGSENGGACRTHCVDSIATPARLTARRRRLSAMILDAAEVVACSDLVAEVFRKEFPDLPIRVLGHGIELPRYQRGVRNRAGCPIVFGYIGTLSEAKGVLVLVEAFGRAAIENARLEIIGSSYANDGFSAQLQKLRGPEIRIRDGIDHRDIPQALASFDVFCLPSLVPETFSLALHEGFAAGLPALVSNIGWPARAVESAACGRAVPVGDVEAWSKAIVDLARNPDILRSWRDKIPLQTRIEEEGFFYDNLYRHAAFNAAR